MRRVVRRLGLAPFWVVALWATAASALADDRLPVVVSFSVIADMVEEVGGERVAVTTLVGADGDAHVFTPSPAHAAAVSEAAVLFVNGLGLEGWLERLVEAAHYTGPVVTASREVTPIVVSAAERHGAEPSGSSEQPVRADAASPARDRWQAAWEQATYGQQGVADPHAWHSFDNARAYVKTIVDGLSAADPAGAKHYADNGARYLESIDEAERELAPLLSALPQERRTVVTSHDAFGYLARDHGLTVLAPQSLSTDAEASAMDVARLIRHMRQEEVNHVFLESAADNRMIERIADETDAAIAGTLYAGALSGVDGPAPTYLAMMRHNIETLASALSGVPGEVTTESAR